MRGNKKEIAKAAHFLEAFGPVSDEDIDVVLRCVNMLREAKGHKKIDGYLIYGSVGCVPEDDVYQNITHFMVNVRCGGSVLVYEEPPRDYNALRIVVGVEDLRKLPEVVRRALRAMEELKPLGSRCDLLHFYHGHICPPPSMAQLESENYQLGSYAEIRDCDF